MHTLLRSSLSALLALPLAGAAVAQVTPTRGAAVIPYQPTLGEHVAIEAWSGLCPAPQFDADQTPTIEQVSHVPGEGGPQQDQYTHELVYRMVDPELCFSPPPPASFDGVIDLGNALPQGHHTVHVKGVAPDDSVYVEYDVIFSVGPTEDFREDVSGMWFAPEQNGRGVTVALRGDTVVVYWATHDAEGDPAWAVLTAPRSDEDERNIVEGTALVTRGAPLAPGAADLAVEAWGTLRFEYRRCGQATLAWDALDPAIEDGELDLIQILQPDGVYTCDVQQLPGRVAAEWVE